MECKRVKMTKTISKKKIDVLISPAIRTYSKVISITLDRVLVQDMKKKWNHSTGKSGMLAQCMNCVNYNVTTEGRKEGLSENNVLGPTRHL